MIEPRGYFVNHWDVRFLKLAREISSWSKDPSTKVGAVIVRPDKTIASMGYNGFHKRMEDRPSLYENREEKYSRIIHAEINALIHAREPIVGYSLYTYPLLPCDRCVVQFIQAGIAKIVSVKVTNPELASRWEPMLEKTRKYCQECNYGDHLGSLQCIEVNPDFFTDLLPK